MRDLRAVAELRDLHLAKVQRDHEQRTQVEKRLLRDMAAAEEARSAKARAEKEARERAEAEAKKEADRKAAEAKRQAEERERREKEERSKAEQRAKLEAEAKAKAKDAAKAQAQAAAARAASPSAAAGLMTTGVAPAAQVPPTIPQGEGGGPSTAPRLKISERAAETERILKVKLVEMRAQSQPFEADESRKKERKMLERKLILHVQQVSATQQQVRRKSMELVELLQDPRQPKPFLILTFAAKLLSQCEVQVQKLPQFAFALAQVTVNVAMQVPLVMDILLAELHRVCIYTVPKHYVFTQNTLNSDEEYYSLLGYRMEDGKLETTDSYVGRMVGYVTFYAAITQTDVVGGQHPHGLANAWTWCAALLRRLPPNRATASVLEAFLKVAGFRLYQSYRKPFEKLLTSVLHEFVGALRDQNNADTRAAVSRIETYANTRRFLQPPEGRDMPVSDDSSRYRA